MRDYRELLAEEVTMSKYTDVSLRIGLKFHNFVPERIPAKEGGQLCTHWVGKRSSIAS